MGLLKVLLGKPGTLHSPGHIFPSALGVPPDLREASGFRRLVKDHGRVGMWLRPHRSRGSGVPQLPGKGRSLALSTCGTVSQPVCLATLYLLFTSPTYARYYATSWLRVCMRVIFHNATSWLRLCMGQGVRGRLVHLVLALHLGFSECWPKKNLAKTGHPKMANFFGPLAKKNTVF